MRQSRTSRFLFDLTSPQQEKQNLIDSHPKIAAELQKDLKKWAATLKTLGIPDGELRGAEKAWYDHFFAIAGAKVQAKPLHAADQKGKQKGPGNRENPFAELEFTQEQQSKVREFQKSMQAEMKKASESRDREKMQAAQKKRLASLAKILNEEQMKKYKAAVAKIRKARLAAKKSGR